MWYGAREREDGQQSAAQTGQVLCAPSELVESQVAWGQDGAQTAGDAAGAVRTEHRGVPTTTGNPTGAGGGVASEARADGAGAGGAEKKYPLIRADGYREVR